MNNAMEATGLTKHYGNFLAVDHVSFEVKEGKIFGFLDPNGAGKTTTIRLLTGQTRPTSGSLTVSGTQKMSGGRMYKKNIFFLHMLLMKTPLGKFRDGKIQPVELF